MPNIPIKMNKIRTIIRLYESKTGLKPIAVMARTSRTSVKKYIQKWNALNMSYEELQKKSDAELHALFCVSVEQTAPNPRMEELDRLMPDIIEELRKKGMTTLLQWESYRKSHPDGYGLTWLLSTSTLRRIRQAQCIATLTDHLSKCRSAQ
jgi:transposase